MISPAARAFMVGELARRAGVQRSDFCEWRVTIGPGETTVELGRGSRKVISFPHRSADFTACARLEWPHGRPSPHAGAQLIVPHVASGTRPIPLFTVKGSTVTCAVDLLTSSFLTLNRYEETVSQIRDEYDRFPYSASLAARERFIDRPIVDEYGLALEQVIREVLPRWQPRRSGLRLKVSHDIDRIGIPFKFSAACGATVKRKRPLDTATDFASALGWCDPSRLRAVRRIAQISIDRNLDSAVYWMATSPARYDSGYELDDPRVRRTIAWLRDRGIELGVHPGFETFNNFNLLAEQVDRIRRATGVQRMGGRQHYLRWSPHTWEHWERAGLAYDSTVGYAERIGFRAGTCIPYRPWIKERPALLTEIPLVVMDCTLCAPEYMRLHKDQMITSLAGLADRCRAVGGVLTMLVHNDQIEDPVFGRKLYLDLLHVVGPATKYAWEDEPEPFECEWSAVSIAA